MKSEFSDRKEAAAREAVKSLRKIREALGWSQRELGERMGLTGKRAQSTVGDWETGARPISENVLSAMAEALGQTVSVELRYVLTPMTRSVDKPEVSLKRAPDIQDNKDTRDE